MTAAHSQKYEPKAPLKNGSRIDRNQRKNASRNKTRVMTITASPSMIGRSDGLRIANAERIRVSPTYLQQQEGEVMRHFHYPTRRGHRLRDLVEAEVHQGMATAVQDWFSC